MAIPCPVTPKNFCGMNHDMDIQKTEHPTESRPLPNQHFPACFVEFCDGNKSRSAAFYLAAEEYIARNLPADNYLFTWIVSPTVVIGRNQSVEEEVNLPYCREHHIDVVRRKSGGGCIYADEGNIMTSWITGSGAVEPLFAEYAAQVCSCLRNLGAPVEVSGRNDIRLSEGGKICGNAFYHLPERNIVHGTMLYDTANSHMGQALLPSPNKLKHHGVQSVRSRIGLLKDVLDIDIYTLRNHLRHSLCDRTLRLSATDIQAIEAIETQYYQSAYRVPAQSAHAIRHSAYIPHCGTLTILLEVAPDGKINGVDLTGDFFENENADTAFRKALTGKAYTKAELTDAVLATHPETSIRGLTTDALMDLLTP